MRERAASWKPGDGEVITVTELDTGLPVCSLSQDGVGEGPPDTPAPCFSPSWGQGSLHPVYHVS